MSPDVLGDADRAAPVRDEFWLCDPCEAILLIGAAVCLVGVAVIMYAAR